MRGPGQCYFHGQTPATVYLDKSYEDLSEDRKCRCVYPNMGADCSSDQAVCVAGSRCQAVSEAADDLADEGIDLRFWDEVVEEDGAKVLRAKPDSWFGDERDGTRPMSVHVWWWKNDEGHWVRFDEFNSVALEQAYGDDRSRAVVDFAGFARGTVAVNLGDMTMGDSVTPDANRRLVRRQASTGQQHVPETLNGRVEVETLTDAEAVRRATVLP